MNTDAINRSPLGKLIGSSLGQQELLLKREEVSERFCRYFSSPDIGNLTLALHPFTGVRPLCYYSTTAFEATLELFERNPKATLHAFSKHSQGWSHAMDTLFRPGVSWEQEGRIRLQAPDDLLAFERIWHPEYQRYAEHVFNHLVKVPLELLGAPMGKDFVALPLSLRAEKLIALGYPALAKGFMSTVRNAISHGATYYSDHEVRYVDTKCEEKLLPSDIERLFDDLVDSCSGIAAAALAFIARQQTEVEAFGFGLLPLGLRCAVIRGWVSHSAFTVTGALKVKMGDSSHLNIYCYCPAKSRSLHRYEALRTAAFAVQVGCSNVDRICVSIDCGLPNHSLIVLNCSKLIEALRPEASDSILAEVVQTDLLWHDSNTFSRKWFLLKTSFYGAWLRLKRDTISKWKKSELNVWGQRYTIRNIENRSADSKRRLLAEVVLNAGEQTRVKTILGVVRHAIKILSKKRIPSLPFGKIEGIRGRPSYVWIRLHSYDARVRALQSRHYRSDELLAEAEWMTRFNRSQPVFVKQPDAVIKGIRIRLHRFKPDRPI
jgi:hypothetical protein